MPKRFTGNAVAIKQARSYTFGGTWAVGETITLTIGTKTLIITLAGTVTTTAVATAVYQAYANITMSNGSAVPPVTGGGATTGGGQAHPEFAELVATNPSAGVVTLTGGVAGRPVTITPTTNSVSGTITPGTLTAATGPNHADDIDNYDDNDALANSDELVFDFSSAALKYALDQSSLQLLSITKTMAFTDDVGLAEVNEDGNAEDRFYTEWRERRFKTGLNAITTTSHLETGEGNGSQLYRHNGTNAQQTWNVHNRGQRRITGVPCILLMGTHASNELNNINGDVGFGFYADEASTLGTFRQGNGAQNNKASTIFGAVVNLLSCTMTVNGGTVVTNSGICTTSGSATLISGDWTHNAGNVKALTIQGGTFRCKAAAAFSGTISIYGGGKLDLSQGAGAVTFATAIQLYEGAEIDDPNGRIAATTQFVVNCPLEKIKWNLGAGRTLTKAA